MGKKIQPQHRPCSFKLSFPHLFAHLSFCPSQGCYFPASGSTDSIQDQTSRPSPDQMLRQGSTWQKNVSAKKSSRSINPVLSNCLSLIFLPIPRLLLFSVWQYRFHPGTNISSVTSSNVATRIDLAKNVSAKKSSRRGGTQKGVRTMWPSP